MIQIVTSANRSDFEPQLATMFEDRKRVFVDLFKWDVPVRDGRFEIDEFDNDDAVYLLALDGNGQHLGSIRLLRTDRPHILGCLFSTLCADGVPNLPTALEITRLCVTLRLRADARLVVRNRLISAMVDLALSSGITSLTGVVTESFRIQVMDMGWACEPLGPPQLIDDSMLAAFQIHLDGDTRGQLVANGIYTPHSIDQESALTQMISAGGAQP